MIEFDPRRFRTMPRAHQLVGIRALLDNPAFALFDEMGAGKSKQVVDAACLLFEGGVIDRVVVVCPAAVRGVWTDTEFGQLSEHCWVPCAFENYVSTRHLNKARPVLNWLAVSYDMLRRGFPDMAYNLEVIVAWAKAGKTLLVIDESSALANPRSLQTRACFELRRACQRAVILNGTPNTQNDLSLYGQMAVLDKSILGFKNFYHFRARHARMGGWMNKKVISIENREELALKIKPYCLRRLKSDCLDLPDKINTSPLVVPLTQGTWARYTEMRDELVTFFKTADGNAVVTAANGGAKVVRLQQITSGFVGGVEDTEGGEKSLRWFGEEKLEALVEYMYHQKQRRAGPFIVWCRFRAEMDKLFVLMKESGFQVWMVRGGQSAAERRLAVEHFGPHANPETRDVLLAQQQAGGVGLNLQAASEVYYLSNTFSLRDRLQSEDRVHRPGQHRPCTYTDVVAVGPDGQKTVDGVVLKALRAGQDAMEWTCSMWREAL